MKSALLKVRGRHCRGCEEILDRSLKSSGVCIAEFYGDTMNFFFDEDLSINDIKRAIRNEGYKVN